nr:1,4-dihydroxy-2-naphthoate octaprenyltransferase [Thiospirillum jenense]
MRHWLIASRPRTLILAIAPVIAGFAFAFAQKGYLVWLTAIATLLSAAAIQIGTNLYNDAADFERGTDTPDRLGPPRAAAQGWFTSIQIRRAAHLMFLLAFLCGLILIIRGGWQILLLGLTAIAAGYAYTSGPRPIAYGPFGELYVLLFFGIAAVAGTYYLQVLQLNGAVILSGIAIGLPACAVLLVNNYRDFDTDRRAGRRTLCHILGRQRARLLYSVLLVLPVGLMMIIIKPPQHGLPLLLALPAALRLSYRLWRIKEGRGLNPLLGQTALYQAYLVALLCISLLWAHWLTVN